MCVDYPSIWTTIDGGRWRSIVAGEPIHMDSPVDGWPPQTDVLLLIGRVQRGSPSTFEDKWIPCAFNDRAACGFLILHE